MSFFFSLFLTFLCDSSSGSKGKTKNSHQSREVQPDGYIKPYLKGTGPYNYLIRKTKGVSRFWPRLRLAFFQGVCIIIFYIKKNNTMQYFFSTWLN
ncbi:hypothetical protein HDV64DRAFT_178375 [Trichoderma sp. TUCIM 5745]